MNYEQKLMPAGQFDENVARLLGDDRRHSDDFPSRRAEARGLPFCGGCENGQDCGSTGESCGCGQEPSDNGYGRVIHFGVEGGVLAALYVPLQCFNHLYDMDTALRRGTLFSELDKPFFGSGKEVNCRGQYE